jgi:hypothetical protein
MEQLELNGVINPRAENWRLEISRDDWSESPRQWDNLGQFLTRSTRYVESELETALDFSDYTLDELEKALEKQGYICERVSVYDHSGVSVYIGAPCCRWDSGYIGLYVVNKARAREWFNVKRISRRLKDKIKESMIAEVNTFNNWINGNVFEFNLFKNGEHVDSCGGFIADSWLEAVEDMSDHIGVDGLKEKAVFIGE